MNKVWLYSGLLIVGLVGSQLLPSDNAALSETLRVLMTLALAFIMLHVGLEFEIDRTQPRKYLADGVIAATAAGLPWILVAFYFVFVMRPRAEWSGFEAWKEALLTSCFAAPTSAGILFSMLAAAGLTTTWLFKKARVLAIFDDLVTVLLLIPLKMMIVGLKWQLALIVVAMAALLWLAWRYLHSLRWPTTWPWFLAYSAAIVAVSELIYAGSKLISEIVPIHIEVLLPAFALGCMLVLPAHHGEHAGPHSRVEERVTTSVSAVFMVLVGLSMPKIALGSDMSAATLAVHVLAVTLISNIGKMVPLFCYSGEATLRERLALCIGMWPRGEVGAGVLVISLGFGIAGASLTVAVLSLALNLLCTGLFIVAVKKLLVPAPRAGGPAAAAK
jgi:Kef-type K+ transport system membrane component KefB